MAEKRKTGAQNTNMTKAQEEKTVKKQNNIRIHIPEAGEHAAAGRQYYTEYEKELITQAARSHMTAAELAAKFATDPLCTPRSITALGYQLSTERDRLGMKKKYGHYVRGKNRTNMYTPAERIETDRRDTEERELPTLDLTQVKVEPNKAEVDAADMAVNREICQTRDITASIISEGLNYRDMQMNVGLLKRFSGRTRAVPGDGTKMLFVSDLAEFWDISEEDALLRIDSLIRHHFPFSRKGHEVSLIEPKQMFGSGLVNVQIDNVPSRQLAGGVTCTPIGVISDTHYGAKGCAEDLVNEFYCMAHDIYGVRSFFHAGDFFDGSGVYTGQPFEQNFLGFDTQVNEVAWKYPFYTDSKTYAILGNHDEAYLKSAGANILFALHSRRRDIIPVGIYQALVSVNGFNINLHHVAGSCNSLFPESKLNAVRQRKDQVIDFFDLDYLDLVVVGHLHKTGELFDPNNCKVKSIVFGGSFQKANPFSTRIAGVTSAIGGYVANLYRWPDGRKRVDTIPIFFDLKNREDVERPKTLHLNHLSVQEEVGQTCS